MRSWIRLGLVIVGVAATALLARTLSGCRRDPELPLSADLGPLDPALGRRIRDVHTRIVRSPRDVAAWGELGMVCEANELLEPAFASYVRASELAPADARWSYRTARIHTKLGRIPEAVAAMEDATRLDPRLSTAHWQLGLLRLSAGDLAGAEADFRRATGADPNDPSGWIGLARVHLQRDESQPAIDMLRRALTLRGGNQPYAHFLLGRAHQLAGRTEEALAELALGKGEKAIWSDPFADEMLRYRVGFNVSLEQARALVFSNQPARAIPILEGLRRDHPEDASVINSLADAYSGAGRPGDARALLEEGLRKEPGSCTMRLNLAVVLYREGNVAAALEEVERTLALDPTLAKAHEMKGIYLLDQKRYVEAIAAFQAELAYDERNAQVRVRIGEILLGLRRHAEAAETLEQATRVDPGLADAWLHLGRARMELGDLDRAAVALQQARRLAPKESGRPDAALVELEKRRAAARPAENR